MNFRLIDRANARVHGVYQDCYGEPYKVIGVSFFREPGISGRTFVYLETVYGQNGNLNFRQLRFRTHEQDRPLKV